LKTQKTHTVEKEVSGPWSLATSREFWEGFAPAALGGHSEPDALSTTYRVEVDWDPRGSNGHPAREHRDDHRDR
jgi:DNA-3-methyladenine glycosylase II